MTRLAARGLLLACTGTISERGIKCMELCNPREKTRTGSEVFGITAGREHLTSPKMLLLKYLRWKQQSPIMNLRLEYLATIMSMRLGYGLSRGRQVRALSITTKKKKKKKKSPNYHSMFFKCKFSFYLGVF